MASANEVRCLEVRPARRVSTLAEDVLAGLFGGSLSLPPKYFYDAEGSRLFDRICDAPEYYLTRAEDTLLARHAAEVLRAAGPQWILELGSGFSRKTRRLLDACEATGVGPEYLPFDVSRETLLEAGGALARDYPWLEVRALAGDYLAGLEHAPRPRGPGLAVFLGSTIGNFEHARAVAFLAELRAFLGADGALLVGADRVKAPATLHAAYNDAAGLTARFNRNLLRVLNRGLDADFDPHAFHHYAPYHVHRAQVEMYLVATRTQRVRVGGLGRTLELAEGDAIHTEISRKFTRASLEALLAEAGFSVVRHHAAADPAFSLVLARPALPAQ